MAVTSEVQLGGATVDESHPLRQMVLRRTILGVVTLLLVSIVVFAATEVLPGNAAYAILGHTATAGALHTLERQLHLNQGLVQQYWLWLSGVLSGHPGHSLIGGTPVWSLVRPRILNSAVVVVVAGFIGVVIGIALGTMAALRRDGWFDHVTSASSLAVTAMPEFVVAIVLVFLFSTSVLHVLPATSTLTIGTYAWSQPKLLVLPVATLVIVIVPYIHRMMRAAMIEALESDYVEMARLNGVPPVRVAVRHAVPNALAPTVQVVGLTFLYLAGGIVVVEVVFNFPGVGAGLVTAVANRDIPTVQFIVLVLAAFYVVVNIATDVIALSVSPRRMHPR